MLAKSKDIPESIENNEAIMNIHNGKVGRQVIILKHYDLKFKLVF